MRTHCDASLKRLGTDYLDIYMLHWPINERSVMGAPEKLPALPEVLDSLRQLKRAGKIRYAGISNFGVRQLTEVLNLGGEIVTNELAYNLLSRAIEIEILPLCGKNGLGIIGYSPLMQGILSGKYGSIDEIPPNRTRTRHFRGDRPASRHGEAGAEPETWEAYTALREIAGRTGVPMGRLAIAWCVGHEAVTCTIAGARNRSQLEENVRGAELDLSIEIMNALDEATAPLRDKLGKNPDYYQSDASSRSY
jgi:aryl-alcohol dehydrogenase-like predicted oxidoreductase